jgi:hypothetical protein
MMPSDTLDLASPFDPSRIDDVSRLSNFPTSRRTMSSSTALLARITMLVSAIDTDTSFDPSRMIDDVSTFIFCISTLHSLFGSDIFFTNDDVSTLTSATPLDPSIIEDVSTPSNFRCSSDRSKLSTAILDATLKDYMGKRIYDDHHTNDSSNMRFKKTIYFGESHNTTDASLPLHAFIKTEKNDCPTLGVSSLTPADEVSILSTLPPPVDPLVPPIPIVPPDPIIANFKTYMAARIFAINADHHGDDDIPPGLLSTHPAILEAQVGDDFPSGLLSSFPVLHSRFLQDGVGNDIPLHSLSTAAVLRSNFLRDAVGDSFPSGLLSIIPALRSQSLQDKSTTPHRCSPSSIELLQPLERVVFHTHAPTLLLETFADFRGVDLIEPAKNDCQALGDSSLATADVSTLLSILGLPSSFLHKAASDDTPSGLLSSIPALRSQLLQDTIVGDIPSGFLSNHPELLATQAGDNSPLSAIPVLRSEFSNNAVGTDSPSNFLSNIPALWSQFLEDKSTPNRRSHSNIDFFKPLERVFFHPHDHTLHLANLTKPHRATLIRKNNDVTAFDISSLPTANDISTVSILRILRSRVLHDADSYDRPSGFLSNHPELLEIHVGDNFPSSMLSSVPVYRFLKDAVGDNFPSGLLSTVPFLAPRFLQTTDCDDVSTSSNIPAFQSPYLPDAAGDDIPLLVNIPAFQPRVSHHTVGKDIPMMPKFPAPLGLLMHIPNLRSRFTILDHLLLANLLGFHGADPIKPEKHDFTALADSSLTDDFTAIANSSLTANDVSTLSTLPGLQVCNDISSLSHTHNRGSVLDTRCGPTANPSTPFGNSYPSVVLPPPDHPLIDPPADEPPAPVVSPACLPDDTLLEPPAYVPEAPVVTPSDPPGHPFLEPPTGMPPDPVVPPADPPPISVLAIHINHSNDYMAEHIDSSKTIFKKNIYFGKSHVPTGTSDIYHDLNIHAFIKTEKNDCPALGVSSLTTTDDISNFRVCSGCFQERPVLLQIQNEPTLPLMPTIPMGLLSNVPALRTQFLKDNIPTTAPGAFAPPTVGNNVPLMSTYPHPPGFLSPTPALRSRFVKNKSTTPRCRSPNSIQFLKPLERVYFHPHDHTLLIANLAEPHRAALLNITMLLQFPDPLDLLSHIQALRSRFLKKDISTLAPRNSSPPAEISTLWHNRNHGYVSQAHPNTPFGHSSPSVVDIYTFSDIPFLRSQFFQAFSTLSNLPELQVGTGISIFSNIPPPFLETPLLVPQTLPADPPCDQPHLVPKSFSATAPTVNFSTTTTTTTVALLILPSASAAPTTGNTTATTGTTVLATTTPANAMMNLCSGFSSTTTPGLTDSTSPTMPATFFYPPGRPPGVILNCPGTWTTLFTKIQDQDFFSHDGFSSLIFLFFPNSKSTTCLATFNLRIHRSHLSLFLILHFYDAQD